MTAKFKALDIANFFIQLVNNTSNNTSNNTIDNLKLNKLLYYTQGISMAYLHRPMFSDEIQAWEYGPVVPEVYHKFKHYGETIIDKPVQRFDENALSSEEIEILTDVYANYGQYSGLALKNMTHIQGSPWRQTYVPGMNKTIPLDVLASYFETHEKIKTIEDIIKGIPTITAIPSSWDSAEDSIYD